LIKVAVGPVPHKEFSDQEATTRKVADLQYALATPEMPAVARVLASLRRYRIWYAVILSAAVAGGIVLASGTRKRAPSRSKAASAPVVAVPVVLPTKLVLEPTLLAPPKPEQPPPAPKTIRLEIGVEPAEAMLTLDGASMGHQLAVEAPEDQSVHMVNASAPGFLAFSQKIEYSKDVRLKIQLRPIPASARGAGKPHVAKAEAKSPVSLFEARSAYGVRPAPAPVKMDAKALSKLPQATEPGVNLGHPSQRRTSKPIDEKDPYAQ
jgi:hypothetical protein